MDESSTETSSEEEVNKRKRKRRRINVKVDGGNVAIGKDAKVEVNNFEEQQLQSTIKASRVLEDFDSFLQDVIKHRGPEKDRIESFILQTLLPYIEDHALKCRSPCGDLLEVLAKLGSPSLKAPRIAKRALKLLDKFIHLDLGNGTTNAYIVATEKCLRQPIVNGSFREELIHDQRRRIDVYCNVLMALLIGRAHGNITYPYNQDDKDEIRLCIREIEKILGHWPLPRKYRRRLSLEVILQLLECLLGKKKKMKRLKGLLDRCEEMLLQFDESSVETLLHEIGHNDDDSVEHYLIMKMLHTKVNNNPEAFKLLKAIVTKHDLFSPTWHHNHVRDHWHFALLACQIFVDVIVNHRFKATREDAAYTLAGFCTTKAYKKSVVINAITKKYISKAAFAPDNQSRRALLEHCFNIEDKLPDELLLKRICTSNQSGDLELNKETIRESDYHLIMYGLYLHKPAIAIAIPINLVSSLFTVQNQETSPVEKRLQNAIAVTQHLCKKSTEHVPVCYTADTTSLPYHMIMEHMTNGDLLKFLKDRRERTPPSYRDILKICLSIATNMEFFHKHRVVHTQLRAENILVGETLEHTKITGLSRARHAPGSEFENGFKGEPLSPEAVRWANQEGLSEPPVYSFKSDIWAFGVVMYEVITCGNVPYSNENLMKVRKDIIAGRTFPKERMMKDGFYQLMQRCFANEEIFFTDICNELRKLISECDEIDDRPIVLPENISTPMANEEQDFEDYDDFQAQLAFNKSDFRPRSNSDKVRFKLSSAALTDESQQHVKKLKNLKHPYLVRVLDIQNKKTRHATRISFEHYTGPNLRQYIQKHRCTEDELIRFAAQISSAVNFLHSNDIVHCNITLDKIVLVNNEHVKLSGLQYTRSLKFGYGENYSTSTINIGQIPEYLHRWNAKEVIQEGVVCKASDIWSLGILMWEMFHTVDFDEKNLTMEKIMPFPQNKDSEILAQLNSGTRPSKPSKCPDWLYIVMTQCWLLYTSERASSALVLDCLTSRLPWETYLLQNWLSKHKVYENTPNLNIFRANAEENIAPPQDDVMESITEEFSAEHDYEYASWSVKRGFKKVFNRVRSVLSPTPSIPQAVREPQEMSWSLDVPEVVRNSRSSSILSESSSSHSGPNLLNVPLPPVPSHNSLHYNLENSQEQQMRDASTENMNADLYSTTSNNDGKGNRNQLKDETLYESYDDLLRIQREHSKQPIDEQHSYTSCADKDAENDQPEEDGYEIVDDQEPLYDDTSLMDSNETHSKQVITEDQFNTREHNVADVEKNHVEYKSSYERVNKDLYEDIPLIDSREEHNKQAIDKNDPKKNQDDESYQSIDEEPLYDSPFSQEREGNKAHLTNEGTLYATSNVVDINEEQINRQDICIAARNQELEESNIETGYQSPLVTPEESHDPQSSGYTPFYKTPAVRLIEHAQNIFQEDNDDIIVQYYV